jgi:hypothetical protein
MQTSPRYLTLGDIARRYGCQVWQVRRVILRGLIPEPARVGAYLVIPESEC